MKNGDKDFLKQPNKNFKDYTNKPHKAINKRLLTMGFKMTREKLNSGAGIWENLSKKLSQII